LGWNNKKQWNNKPKQWDRKPKDKTIGDGIYVEVRNNDVNKALRIFKKKLQNEGILQEYKERQHYVKPSEKKRKEKAAGKKRWQKKQEKLANERGY
jgi:small subunit ribosomal protein S21|tara:strand:+ start:523 stop:810 length:288 start_codon:yes stop_codon:yes gene_type:complete